MREGVSLLPSLLAFKKKKNILLTFLTEIKEKIDLEVRDHVQLQLLKHFDKRSTSNKVRYINFS